MMFLVALTYAQPTTNPGTPPARDASDVISIYGGGNDGNPYTDVAGTDYAPFWGQPGAYVAPVFVDVSGNEVLFYEDLSYQGMVLGSNQNAAAMEFLHVDVWSPIDDVFQITPINGGGVTEALVNVPVTGGQWTSIDIPKANFTGMTWDNVFQFKSEKQGWGADGPRGDFYIDNLYFWKEAVDPTTDATLSSIEIDNAALPGFAPGTTEYDFGVPSTSTSVPEITLAVPTNTNATTVITDAAAVPGNATIVVTAEDGVTTETYTISYEFVGPTSAAPTPAERDDENVVNFYSDAYSQEPFTNFDAEFCGPNSFTELDINGDNLLQWNNNACQGILLQNTLDVTSFTTLHFDFWVNDGTDLTGAVIDLKFNETQGNGDPADDTFLSITLTGGSTPAIVTGQWVSAEIPVDLSAFDNLDELVVTIPTGPMKNNTYYDNFFLSGGTLSNATFTKAELTTYPNPTTDVWNIETNVNISKIQVYNVMGKLVSEQKVDANQATISSEGLSSGVYFAKIESDTKSLQTIRLIKK
ncbi:T9SS type A sorting domain-containing protein [Psychroflexus aestuariivivens]|uniref:T9SS type A sorting domain-containing protein n=1 Tax=Psychroflexus aestuariivivens TaxID=1795040 RepID=UPI001300B547|nr:T9SS type A sorting domain-containing protein [Psychroflexus aestuariivivens]